MFKLNSLTKLLALIICAFLLTAGVASGQAKKKKKRTAKRPVATKPATKTGDATVISLADQYENSSNQIIQPNSTPSLAATETKLPDDTTQMILSLQERIKKLEAPETAKKSTYEERQKMLLTNLDILTKAEQRVESLRKQRFDLVEKENSIRSRIDQIDVDIRPESIEKNIALVGTLRPEELREARRKSLDAERRNLQSMLNEIIASRTSLENNLLRADALVEKLRVKLERDIDNALSSDEPDQ